MASSASSIKRVYLEKVYKGIESLTTFLRPALPYLNSHMTEFYTSNYWENQLHKSLRDDLDLKSLDEVKDHLRDLANGNWRNYSSAQITQNKDFRNATTLQELIVCTGQLQLSEMGLSESLNQVRLSGKLLYEAGVYAAEGKLKFDTIMSAKKTHEVDLMSDVILGVSKLACDNYGESKTDGENSENKEIQYLVDMGSGKGYLSSYLTLMHKFKVLAVDSSSVNTSGCEKRSAKLEKVWAQLVRRAVERHVHGDASKRGKRWKSKKKLIKEREKNDVETENSQSHLQQDEESISKKECKNSPPRTNSVILEIDQKDAKENELLKTLTQFVTPDFDLKTSILQHFPCFDSNSSQYKSFGLIGLHTCGSLAVASLKLFIANEKAKFLCNVPCCYHLLEENHVFYPSRQFMGSNTLERGREDLTSGILKPTFPISRKLDAQDSNRFCLGRNARMMSAYSIQRMVNSEKGLDLHSSMIYRSLLQVLIKEKLGDAFIEMEDYPHSVGKIGDKCSDFKEYVYMGLKNLQLDTRIMPSETEIDELYSKHHKDGLNRLHKYYLVRSIFAPLIESVILLDRLAFLLEQHCIKEAYIVQLFDPAVSPRSHVLIATKF